MSECKVTFMNEPDPKRILRVLAEVLAERKGMIVTEVKVVPYDK